MTLSDLLDRLESHDWELIGAAPNVTVGSAGGVTFAVRDDVVVLRAVDMTTQTYLSEGGICFPTGERQKADR